MNYIWPYIAGLFDGEGTFTISSLKRKNLPNFIFKEMYITNSSIILMDFLKENFGGSTRITRYGNQNKNWKDVYKWFPPKGQRKQFIENLLPYLVIKKPQAELLLKLYSLMEEQKANLRSKGGLTKEEFEEREKIYLQVKKLNHRGIK